MPGVFDKIKGKKTAWDRKQEDRKIGEIQRGIDKLFQDFKKTFEKQLGKMGLPISYLALTAAGAEKRNAGFIVLRFNDSGGYPTTVIQGQHIYEGTPFGASFSKRVVYTGATFWGTIVQGSIPFTLLFRAVGKGFMKGTEKVFLPLTSLPFNEKELLNDPRLQVPVVAALNADKNLVDAVDRLPLTSYINLTHKSTMTVSCPDIGGKCVIIPADTETSIFLRCYGHSGEPKTMLGILSRIRKHVLARPHTEKVTGKVPAPVFNTMYALTRAKSPEPSKEAAF